MASSSFHPNENEEDHDLPMPSSSSAREYRPFSVFEPPHKRRNVSESTRLFDVFINHRGPDVKNTLARELYNSLRNLNIKAYLDSEEKELGDSLTSTIITAIQSAAVHIAIFSKGYADSPWCLEELALMWQTTARIIPVFYDVEPCALRFIEKGVYGKAFAQYYEKGRYLKRLEEWKAVLQSASFLTGEELYSLGGCENIVSAVEKEVRKTKCIKVAKYPVGLHNVVEDIEKKCIAKAFQDFDRRWEINQRGEGKAKIVGIFGMGGAGKTTLSKELFNRKLSTYNQSSFLFDVREASAKSNLSSLQMKLLRDLFNEYCHSFTDVEDGANCLRNRISRSDISIKFLIVLDDIDQVQQLDDLCITDMVDKFSDCLVIVTTRDQGVLKNAGITAIYHKKGMDEGDAKELFCWHAFKQPNPASGYDELVDQFVKVCDGLPLSIQVLGSHVHGYDRGSWDLELKKVQEALPQDIRNSLRISIETLGNEEKQIFIDIACFFIGELTSMAIRVWDASGWRSQHALQRLEDKCLVENLGESNARWFERVRNSASRRVHMSRLRMHDHLRDLGRAMADEQSNPIRLWRPLRLKYLESQGFKNIVTQPKYRCLHSFTDLSIPLNIKFFLGKPNNTLEPSTDLLWLELRRFRGFPPWIPLQNLQCLKILSGDMTIFCQRYHVQAPLLKELVIDSILNLKELNLGFLGCLEKLEIKHCCLLNRVIGISDRTKLAELSIIACRNVEFENLSFHKLTCIKLIKLKGCRRLGSVTGISDLGMLEKLHIDMSGTLEFDEFSLYHLHRLKKLTILNCENLKSLSGISRHTELVVLNIGHCGQIDKLSLGLLHCLEELEVHNCGRLKSVTGLSDLTKLVELNINNCGALELQESSLCNLPCLETIKVRDCKNLRSLTGLSHLPKLRSFKISYCETIQDLSFHQLRSVERITIQDCVDLKSVTGLSDLTELVELNISNCGALELQELSLCNLRCLQIIIVGHCKYLRSLKGLSHLPNLCSFKISYCETIQDLSFHLLRNVQRITIEGCRDLKSVAGISDATWLQMLSICGCEKIEELSLVRLTRLKECFISDVSMLKRLEIKGCANLQSARGEFSNLVKLDIYESPGFEKFIENQEMYSLERLHVYYCGKRTVGKCLEAMKKLPSVSIKIIGSAVDGAESNVNLDLFRGLNIANSVEHNGIKNACNHLGSHVLGAIILCSVVKVNTCAAAKAMNEIIKECDLSPWVTLELRQGKWIITLVTMREDDIQNYIVNEGRFRFDYLDFEDVSVKTVSMPVMKGEEIKILDMLLRIVELYQ